CPADRARPDAAPRWRGRRASHRAEQMGARATGRTDQGTEDRTRSNASVRGAGQAGRGRPAGDRVVQPVSGRPSGKPPHPLARSPTRGEGESGSALSPPRPLWGGDSERGGEGVQRLLIPSNGTR